MSGPDVRLVPDLDVELVHAFNQVEELLLTLSAWEDDPDDPAELPAPLGGRVALDALNRVQEAIAPTQTREGRPAPAGGRLLAPDGRYEHRPLRLVTLDPADLSILAATAAVLGHELATATHSELAEAITAGAEAAAPTYGPAPTPVQLVEALARAHGLLDLADTDDTALLRARLLQAGDAGDARDVVLTTQEEHAYARLAARANAMWALSDPLAHFLY